MVTLFAKLELSRGILYLQSFLPVQNSADQFEIPEFEIMGFNYTVITLYNLKVCHDCFILFILSNIQSLGWCEWYGPYSCGGHIGHRQ